MLAEGFMVVIKKNRHERTKQHTDLEQHNVWFYTTLLCYSCLTRVCHCVVVPDIVLIRSVLGKVQELI